jgi:PRTRC genetic system ThiF family protein
MMHYLKKDIVIADQYSPVKILLAGVGGTGSHILTGLARMNQALKALGHPGLYVLAVDGDSVSEANVGRQLFSKADIGRNKATVLVTRLNAFFGTDWMSYPYEITKEFSNGDGSPQIIITAVDSLKSRILFYRSAKNLTADYWMDTGNTADTGQVIFGSINPVEQPDKPGVTPYLPNAVDLYGNNLAGVRGKDDQGPSCSMAEALNRQDLFVNQMVATCALHILWQGFRYGYLTQHGAFIDMRSMTTRPLPVDPETWNRMGWEEIRGKKKGKKKKSKYIERCF